MLLYANDMVVFKKNREQLQEVPQAVLAVVQQALEEWRMQMIIPKTKFLQLGRATGPHQPLQSSEHEIQQVSNFKYPGSIQSSDLSTRAEISYRIASAAHPWLKLSKLHV